MKIIVSRTSDQVYLTLEEYPAVQDYSLKMAEECGIRGLLPCQVLFCDGEERLRYTVTGMNSLAKRYAAAPVRFPDLRGLLSALSDLCRTLPDYLLDSENLLLDPEAVCFQPEDGRACFCYVPGLSGTESGTVRLLAEFLLKHLDHTDQAGTDLAYAFYDKVSEDGCVLSAVLPPLLTHAASPDRPFPSEDSLSPEEYVRSGPVPPAGTSPSADCGQIPAGTPFPGSPGPDGQTCSGRQVPRGQVFSGSAASRGRKHPRRQAPRNSGHSCRRQPKQTSGPVPHPVLPSAVRRKQAHDRAVLILLIALACLAASVSVFFFRMDAAGVGGIGFLSAAVIWLVKQQLEKKGSDLQNIWSDEDEELEDDDTFYQSLLKEVYAQNAVPEAPPPPPSYRKPSQSAPSSSEWSGPVLVSLHPESYNNIPILRETLIIGKDPRQCDVCLKSDTVSRIHAKIEHIGGHYYLTDLFSTNGTYLNGRPLEPNHAVCMEPGSQAAFAAYSYRAELPPGLTAPDPAHKTDLPEKPSPAFSSSDRSEPPVF